MTSSTEDQGSTSSEDQARSLDKLYDKLKDFERRMHRQTVIIFVLVMALVVTASGWWLTARDQAATKQNGQIADCRAQELALTLDQFQIVVSPGTSKGEKEEAADTLGLMNSLQDRYDYCGVTDD